MTDIKRPVWKVVRKSDEGGIEGLIFVPKLGRIELDKDSIIYSDDMYGGPILCFKSEKNAIDHLHARKQQNLQVWRCDGNVTFSENEIKTLLNPLRIDFPHQIERFWNGGWFRKTGLVGSYWIDVPMGTIGCSEITLTQMVYSND